MSITWPDGSVTTYPPYGIVELTRRPLKVNGRMYRLAGTGRLQYEAPAMEPDRGAGLR